MKLINGIECYGELNSSSNFHIVCEDEEDDGIWCEGNPFDPHYVFDSWEQAVSVLCHIWTGTIMQITAV
jgi:hypothetical protein